MAKQPYKSVDDALKAGVSQTQIDAYLGSQRGSGSSGSSSIPSGFGPGLEGAGYVVAGSAGSSFSDESVYSKVYNTQSAMRAQGLEVGNERPYGTRRAYDSQGRPIVVYGEQRFLGDYMSSNGITEDSGGGGTGSGSSASGKQTALGYGGQKTWDVLQKYVMRDEEAIPGLDLTDPADFERLNTIFDKQTGDMTSSIDKLSEINQSYLSGKIPDDVSAQIRRMGAERAQSGGLFGQKGRSLVARDLGLTSLDIQQKGIDQQMKVDAMRGSLAELSEKKRQFQVANDLAINQFKDTVRQRNLQGIALEQERLQFNASQNMQILTLISELVSSSAQVSASMASKNMNPAGVMGTFGGWISSLKDYMV